MKKTFVFNVEVEGQIELTIKAKDENEAREIAEKFADSATIDPKAFSEKAIEDVTETLSFEVGDHE